MTTEKQYATALYDLLVQHPERGQEYLENLKKSLRAKGYQKLLSKIFMEYAYLLEHQERARRYGQVSPESERTRVLLELYRTLVTKS